MTSATEARAMLSRPVEAGLPGEPSQGRESMPPVTVPPVVLERRHWLAALAMLVVLDQEQSGMKIEVRPGGSASQSSV